MAALSSFPKVVVFTGPTASGKTQLLHCLIDHLGHLKKEEEATFKNISISVINLDSRLFYRGFDIGTAKPTPVELEKYGYQLVDFIDIASTGGLKGDNSSEDYNAHRYLSDLDKIIQKSPDHLFFLVGGSTFYLDVVLNGLPVHFPIAPRLKQALLAEYEAGGLAPLLGEIKEKDPEFYNMVDRQNPRRVLRGLEVIRSGLKFSQLRNKREKKNYDLLQFTLLAPRALLYENIRKRVKSMFKMGWIDEVEKLLSHTTLEQLSKIGIIGYSEIAEYLTQANNGATSLKELEEVEEKIVQKTRQFAKRQLTWFKKNRNGWTLFPEYNSQAYDAKLDEWVFHHQGRPFKNILFQEKQGHKEYSIKSLVKIIKTHYLL